MHVLDLRNRHIEPPKTSNRKPYKTAAIVFSFALLTLVILNNVLAWTNPSTAPGTGGGAITFSSGNVGIGTTTPTGKLDVSVANNDNVVGLQITQNDVTNNPRGVTVTNTGTGNALLVTQNGNTSASLSIGGAVNITNTNNTGPGLVVYSNKGASRVGRLATFYDDNIAANTDTVLIQSDSTVNTPLNVKSSATGMGGIKIETLSTGSDSNASALSIDLQGSGTAAQGIFITSTAGGTTGKLLNIRNDLGLGQVELLTMLSGGNVGLGVSAPTAKLHIGGTAGVDGIRFPDGTLQKTAFVASGGGAISGLGTGQGGFFPSDGSWRTETRDEVITTSWQPQAVHLCGKASGAGPNRNSSSKGCAWYNSGGYVGGYRAIFDYSSVIGMTMFYSDNAFSASPVQSDSGVVETGQGCYVNSLTATSFTATGFTIRTTFTIGPNAGNTCTSSEISYVALK